MEQESLVQLTADIVSAHVANNTVAVRDVANLVQKVHGALAGLGAAPAAPEPQGKTPIVSARASIKPDYLVCMECGKKQKTLKRHLMSAHDKTPAQYRSDYGLPASYPMVAPAYSEARRSMAHSIGLGRNRKVAEGESPLDAALEAQGSKPMHDGEDAPAPKRTRRRKAPAKG